MFSGLLAAFGGLLVNSVKSETAKLVIDLVEQELPNASDLGTVFGSVSAKLETLGLEQDEAEQAQKILTDTLRFIGLLVDHRLLGHTSAPTTTPGA